MMDDEYEIKSKERKKELGRQNNEITICDHNMVDQLIKCVKHR
jgi:hypothetical protein